MIVSESQTVRSWQDNRLVVTEYRTDRFDKGNSVTTMQSRSYEVHLYSSNGLAQNNTSKGQHVDVVV